MSESATAGPEDGARLPRHAFLIFTGGGPILVLSTYPEANDPHLVQKLGSRGVVKYIAYEVSLDAVRQSYGETFEKLASELGEVEEIRVLDFNGHQIMSNFALSELGEPIKVGD